MQITNCSCDLLIVIIDSEYIKWQRQPPSSHTPTPMWRWFNKLTFGLLFAICAVGLSLEFAHTQLHVSACVGLNSVCVCVCVIWEPICNQPCVTWLLISQLECTYKHCVRWETRCFPLSISIYSAAKLSLDFAVKCFNTTPGTSKLNECLSRADNHSQLHFKMMGLCRLCYMLQSIRLFTPRTSLEGTAPDWWLPGHKL